MFTGLIEELGAVVSATVGADSGSLSVQGELVTSLSLGDSIAVNGVCLTVTRLDGDVFTADVMRETLRRSTLERLDPGDAVNLERPLTPAGRLGGHIVQGHVDSVGTIAQRTPGSQWETVTVELPEPLLPYVVGKGSIALDGVSLTVADVAGAQISVGLIPETLRRTTLGHRPVGSFVNVEVDVLAKHVERLLAFRMERT